MLHTFDRNDNDNISTTKTVCYMARLGQLLTFEELMMWDTHVYWDGLVDSLAANRMQGIGSDVDRHQRRRSPVACWSFWHCNQQKIVAWYCKLRHEHPFYKKKHVIIP